MNKDTEQLALEMQRFVAEWPWDDHPRPLSNWERFISTRDIDLVMATLEALKRKWPTKAPSLRDAEDYYRSLLSEQLAARKGKGCSEPKVRSCHRCSDTGWAWVIVVVDGEGQRRLYRGSMPEGTVLSPATYPCNADHCQHGYSRVSQFYDLDGAKWDGQRRAYAQWEVSRQYESEDAARAAIRPLLTEAS